MCSFSLLRWWIVALSFCFLWPVTQPCDLPKFWVWWLVVQTLSLKLVGSKKQNSNLGCCGLWYDWKGLLWSSSTWCLISGVFLFKNTKKLKIKVPRWYAIPIQSHMSYKLKSLSTYATCFLIELSQIVVTLWENHFIRPWSRSRTRLLTCYTSTLEDSKYTHPSIHK